MLRLLLVVLLLFGIGLAAGVPAAGQAAARLRQFDGPAAQWTQQLHDWVESLPDQLADAGPAPRQRPQFHRSVPAPVRAASASVLQVTMRGCGRGGLGSGFPIAPERVLTNAHVVRGADRVQVRDAGVRRPARVVLYDPATDVAVLAVPGLRAEPLRFAGAVGAGTAGYVAGYPGGGPLTVVPAQVQGSSGRVWGADRESYALATSVRPGNSGGPLLDREGRVLGVVYAAAADGRDRGYARTSAAVSQEARAGIAAGAETGTGSCAA